MTKRVLVYRPLPAEQLAALRARFDVTVLERPQAHDPDFRAAVATAHGLIGASVKLDRALLDTAPALEIIASISVGYDNYDLPYLKERGILLTNTPDVLTETTADTAFALILATARRVVELANWVRDGHWTRNIGAAHYGTDVHHKRLGIVGFGRIGAAVARRGRLGFGMEVLYCNDSARPELEAELGARRRTLDELLQEADFVCLNLPLLPQTERLIGAREFALMRPETIFINASRGRVVDEAALIEALRTGRIRAAGLDVFEREPLPADSPLPRLPNVVALPHIGSATHETRAAMARCAAENLIEALSGRRPPNLVDASVWEERRAAR